MKEINRLRIFLAVVVLLGVGLGMADVRTVKNGVPDAGLVLDAGTALDTGPVNLDRRLDLIGVLNKVEEDLAPGSVLARYVLWATETVDSQKDSAVVVVKNPDGKHTAIIFVWNGTNWSVFPDQFQQL
jgi:hypothetical protein